MKRICAWCDKPLGIKEGPTDEVTHGICDECLVVQMAAEPVSACITERGTDG